MLYLINHTDSTLGEGKHHGDIDAPLSPKGIKDVGPVSELFKSRKLDLIVTPSTSRNSEMATLLSSITGAPIFVDEGLHTWHQRAFSGWSSNRARQAISVYLKHPDVKVPQGESANSFLKRWKGSFMKYLGMSRSGKNIALILNSLNVEAVAGRFKTLDQSLDMDEGKVYEVGLGLTLKEIR